MLLLLLWEKTIKGFNSQKMIFIVLKKQDNVAKAIKEETGQSCYSIVW